MMNISPLESATSMPDVVDLKVPLRKDELSIIPGRNKASGDVAYTESSLSIPEGVYLLSAAGSGLGICEIVQQGSRFKSVLSGTVIFQKPPNQKMSLTSSVAS